MIRQTLLFPLLVAAIGGPFLLMSGGANKSDENQSSTEADPVSGIKLASFPEDQTTFYKPTQNLAEVFNFQVRPEWVANRFDHVMQSEIDGYKIYRASILSGHGPQDIVGAITYQFDFRGSVKAIRFNGFATEPSQIIQFASRQFAMSPDPNSPGDFATTEYASIKGKLEIDKSKKYDGQYKIFVDLHR